MAAPALLRRACLPAFAACLLSLWASLASAGHTEEMHAQARKALAGQNYQGVIEAYAGQSDLPPAANYRLAIAYLRSGDANQASTFLNRAIEQDRSASFASTPQKVADLQREIDQQIKLAQSQAPSQSTATIATLAAQSSPATVTPTAAPEPTATAAVTSVAQPNEKGHSREAPDNFVALGAGALLTLLTLLALIFFGATKARQRSARAFLGPAGLGDLGKALQAHKAITTLADSLDATSTLRHQLLATLPLLERHIGRQHLVETGSSEKMTPSDLTVYDITVRTAGTGATLADLTPQQVQAIFQCPRHV